MSHDIELVFDVVTTQLPAEGVDVLMIGGHAVNHYGFTRATQDIDFMIASADEDAVRNIMINFGYTNIAVHENVMFFSRPDESLRVDFLKVDRGTMEKLLVNSVEIDYFGKKRIRVPQLNDLLRMKIFALSQGGPRREDKDFADIVNLVFENNVDLCTTLKELCHDHGSDEIYSRLCVRIKELKDD